MEHNTNNITSSYLVITLVYLSLLFFDFPLVELLLKPIPVILIAVATWSNTNKYNQLISLGFIFSALGDFFLTRYVNWFLPGLASFLTAHLLYVFAFIFRSRAKAWPAAIISYVSGIVILYFLSDSVGDMIVPVIFYVLIILTMIWRAFAQFKFNEDAKWAAYGALAFGVSDSVLAFDKFVFSFQESAFAVMFTYWLAQFLIFSSRDKEKNATAVS